MRACRRALLLAALALGGCGHGYDDLCSSPIASVYDQSCNPYARKGGGA